MAPFRKNSKYFGRIEGRERHLVGAFAGHDDQNGRKEQFDIVAQAAIANVGEIKFDHLIEADVRSARYLPKACNAGHGAQAGVTSTFPLT